MNQSIYREKIPLAIVPAYCTMVLYHNVYDYTIWSLTSAIVKTQSIMSTKLRITWNRPYSELSAIFCAN